ncbi:hypothetical protein JCM1841_006609 [Sporobolomyces salmonicolor]
MPPSTPSLRTAFYSVAQAWPQDILRPSLQFSDAIRQAADRVFVPQASSSTPSAPYEGPLNEVTQSQATKAEGAVASLQRLLDDRALKAYPMSDRTTKPASFPKHYARIQDSIARAETGEVFKKKRFAWFRWN